MEFALGGLAACGACFFTNPLDVVKTRMQLQGELRGRGAHAIFYKNSLHAFYVIAKNDGLRSLQKGLTPALCYQWIMNGSRLGLFNFIEDRGWTRDRTGAVSTPRTVIAGAFAGTVSAFLASPFNLVKTQLQSQSKQSIAVGWQHNHTGLLSAMQYMYKDRGVRALWQGAGTSTMRNCIGSSTQLLTFSKCREAINNLEILPANSWKSTLASAMLSGFVVSVIVTPADVLSVRLYNQSIDVHGKGVYYVGPWDSLYKVFQIEGPRGLFKGFTANYLRLGPHTTLLLTFWTLLRELQSSK